MPVLAVVIVVGLVAGMAVGLQSPMTSMLSSRVGMLQGLLLVHLSGALAALAVIAARGGVGGLNWRAIPWYALVVGVPGVIVLSAVSYLIPKAGTVATTTLIVVGQLALSVVVDHFGWLGADVRPFDVQRLAGILVLMLGTWLVIR